MTEKELNQLYWLNRETKQLQENLKDLQSKELYSSPIITGTPRSTTPHDKIAEYVAQKQDLENIIQLNLFRIQTELIRLENYINQIPDSEIRLIMRLRHVNGLNWEDIAAEINCERTTVSKKYKRYLKVNHG